MDELKTRIVAALKRTWEQINPNSRNLYIAPSTSTMCCIALYGEDSEATRAYMAMPETEQQQLLCEVFPEWYPSDPDRQGVVRVPRIPEYPGDLDGHGA